MPPQLPVPYTRHQIVPAHQARDRGGITAFVSSQEQKGDWELPRLYRIACVLGSVVADLREARIPEGEVQVEVFLVLGSIELFVPPGVRVELSVHTFAGEAAYHPDPLYFSEPGAPVLRVTGSAYFGSVEVIARLPGESARDAKRRLKASAKAASQAASRQIGR
ncbi:MAG TPA: LiaF domain-containing protein [Gemmatimonadaceae bacterium]|nr:LiaF domain-containing protein [Gemmatimonadaceae bacterium]